jgi:hypothetical protein
MGGWIMVLRDDTPLADGRRWINLSFLDKIVGRWEAGTGVASCNSVGQPHGPFYFKK